MKRIGANEDYDVHLSHYNKNNSEKKHSGIETPVSMCKWKKLHY